MSVVRNYQDLILINPLGECQVLWEARARRPGCRLML